MVGTIDPLHDELNEAGEHFAVFVQTTDGRRTVQKQGVQALRAVAIESASLAAVTGATSPRISPIAPLPDGVVLRIDDLSTRIDTRRRVAQSIRGSLVDAGIPDAAVDVLPVDGLSDLDRCRRAVVLRMFPQPAGAAGRLSAEWIDVAADWVFGDQRPESTVRLRVLGVERAVRAAEAAGVLHGCAAAHVWCDIVTGDVETRVRTASISFGAAPHVAIAGGGPRCDDDGLIARFELLRDVVRELHHDCAYACLDFEPGFADLGTGLSNTEWALEGGASPNTVAGRLCDRFIPDVFGYQLLGSAHVARLRLADGSRDWGVPLSDDRFELAVGAPVDWLPTSEVRGDVRGDGWDLLDPLLLRGEDLADELSRAASDGELSQREVDNDEAAAGHGLPELDAIVIDPDRHPRRGTRLTVLELAAWLAGEPHSDTPASVSPVLRVFVSHLGMGLDDRLRQDLKPLAARLVGTAGDAARDQQRALRLTDWLVRGHAPPWLRQAGLTESADRLDGLTSITDNTDLVRAVDLLGNAIVTAGRRLEITTAIAGDHADVVDQISWDAWEEAAERSGWVAATEAVLHGIPADLAYAADQRVVECSRDPRIRAELEASSRGLGDAIWSAALHEIAAAAWRGAWDATEEFVHHESTFSIRTALRRSLEDAVGDEDPVVVEAMLDDVDAEARDALAHLVLSEEAEPDYWKRAVESASIGEDGRLWRAALDETRGILGVTLFDDAIEVARTELHRWLDRAPQIVGRVVAAAVAREASGVAGRAVSARAAAERLARGATEEEAEDAARHAIEPIVTALSNAAVALADELAAWELAPA